MRAVTGCPACGRDALAPAVSSWRIELENDLRNRFVTRRLDHRPEFMEAMDLTRFMHGGPGRLLDCQACGSLVRDEEAAGRYEDDGYDPALMKHLYPRYRWAFERKQAVYRPLLRPGAEVIEVGSHLGAFLEAAEAWGWRPTGLDIGEATSAFARRRGFSVKRCGLDDYSPRLRRPEAIFVWNCFEQMEDPAEALRRSRALLDRHGLLVIRIPNADFYRDKRKDLENASSLHLLAYNNLLGFPYRHGYSPAALERLLRAQGFDPIGVHSSSLLTPPYPDLSSRVRAEWRETRHAGESRTGTGGPWIEMVCRRAEHPENATESMQSNIARRKLVC